MRKKKAFVLCLKIFLSVGLILWITHNVSLEQVWLVIADAHVTLLFFAFSLFFVGYFITAFRWRMLIRAQGGDAPILYLVRSFMVAIFFNNFLPSTIGGDAVRMYDSWRLGNTTSGAVSVVLVDRFLGVLALLLIALIALLMDPHISTQFPSIAIWVGITIFSAGLLVWIVLNTPPGKIETFALKSSGVIHRLAGFLGKVLNTLQSYKHSPGAVVRALLLSFLLQLNVVVHFIFLTRALGINVPIEAMFFIIPVAIFVMMLPVSINGIGLRETVFVFLFSLFGVPHIEALALAWLAYSFSLAQGILGGMVFALRREHSARPA